MQIAGKIALITGASEGIGAACATVFAKRGAQSALVARSREKLKQASIPGSLSIVGDLRDENFRRAVVEQTIERYGRIDVLINNAGVGLYMPAHSAPMDQAREMFELNFFAALHLIQLTAPHMQRQQSGTIVNVGSIGGKVTLPWFTLYSASKYALGSLTDGLRVELKQSGIHAMTVCPGYVKTGFQKNVLQGKPPDLAGLSARWAITAERCAEAIANGVERRARTVVVPSSGWLFIALARLLPGLVDRQMESMYRKQMARA